MLAHASRNPSSGSRCVRHVPAVANVSPATGLIWPRVVGAKNRAILFGYERLFVTAHPVGQCLAFAHVRIEGVCSGFTNDWDDDRSNSRGVPGCGFSNMQALRLEIRGFCPQWVIHIIPAIPACPVLPKSGHSVVHVSCRCNDLHCLTGLVAAKAVSGISASV